MSVNLEPNNEDVSNDVNLEDDVNYYLNRFEQVIREIKQEASEIYEGFNAENIDVNNDLGLPVEAEFQHGVKNKRIKTEHPYPDSTPSSHLTSSRPIKLIHSQTTTQFENIPVMNELNVTMNELKPQLRPQQSMYNNPSIMNTDSQSGIKTYNCLHCAYTSNRPIYEHIRRAHPETTLRCDKCTYTTFTTTKMNLHKDVFHNAVYTGILKCERCKFIATKVSSLEHHQTVHRTKPPFKCPLIHNNCRSIRKMNANDRCEFSASKTSHFNYHILTHNEDRPYFCPYCDFSISRSYLLRKHLELHQNLIQGPA